nr:coiled coil domain containing protein 113 [Hymenolepis microstoma]
MQLKHTQKIERDYVKLIEKQTARAQNGNITAEKLSLFLEEVLKTQDTLVERLRLNNSTLRSRRKKMLTELKQMEEIGEVLHEVDFEQLKIENSQFLEIIDTKNQELVRLKLTAGRITQALNSRKLAQISQESSKTLMEIKSREEQISKTNLEIEQVEKEKRKIEVLIEQLKKLAKEYKVPTVMDYVTTVQEMRLLKRSEKLQNRKFSLAKTNLERSRRTWHQLRKSTNTQPL